MDGFVGAHQRPDIDGPDYGLLTMGYYTRADLPFHYALADAYTICDNYFCSILGPTDPNRVMMLSGSIDPEGLHGGPVTTTASSASTNFAFDWVTVPELLEDAGISWKTYTAPGQGYSATNTGLVTGDATLQYFTAYRNPSTRLFQRAFLPTYPNDFARDVSSGSLPAVSWIIPPNGFDEIPPTSPHLGAWLMDSVLSTLASNPTVWSKTVLFISYDENGGFFDHVAPPTPPPGEPGEYLNRTTRGGPAQGVAGPIGLGFRVPMLVVSPFSQGGRICSETFDHTSQIRFLEQRFGIHASAISTWRRRAVGDLTATVFGAPQSRVPPLPATSSTTATSGVVQATDPPVTPQPGGPLVFTLPSTQRFPDQEVGSKERIAIRGGPVTLTIGPFAQGSADVGPLLQVQIVGLAKALIANTCTRIRLVGFCDDEVGAPRARSLSLLRAQHVAVRLRGELTSLGYRSIQISSAGEGTVLVPGTVLSSRATVWNRRVVASGN